MGASLAISVAAGEGVLTPILPAANAHRSASSTIRLSVGQAISVPSRAITSRFGSLSEDAAGCRLQLRPFHRSYFGRGHSDSFGRSAEAVNLPEPFPVQEPAGWPGSDAPVINANAMSS